MVPSNACQCTKFEPPSSISFGDMEGSDLKYCMPKYVSIMFRLGLLTYSASIIGVTLKHGLQVVQGH